MVVSTKVNMEHFKQSFVNRIISKIKVNLSIFCNLCLVLSSVALIVNVICILIMFSNKDLLFI